jgi:HAD superfamily hydrolase (TIGR01509 family)
LGTPELESAVLFDLDGVLVESEGLKARAHAAAIAELGDGVIAPPLLYREVIGQSIEVVSSRFMAAAGIDVAVDRYVRVFANHYHSLLARHVTASAGAENLLAALDTGGWRLAVVTSSDRTVLEEILRRTRLPAFSVEVCSEDIPNPKPSPECYRRALSLLAVSASRAVVIEDTQPGIEAALAADLRVVAVRHPWNASQDLSRADAHLDSLSDTAGIVRLIEHLTRKR